MSIPYTRLAECIITRSNQFSVYCYSSILFNLNVCTTTCNIALLIINIIFIICRLVIIGMQFV